MKFVAAGPVSRIRRVALHPRRLLNRGPATTVNDVNLGSNGRFPVTLVSQPPQGTPHLPAT